MSAAGRKPRPRRWTALFLVPALLPAIVCCCWVYTVFNSGATTAAASDSSSDFSQLLSGAAAAHHTQRRPQAQLVPGTGDSSSSARSSSSGSSGRGGSSEAGSEARAVLRRFFPQSRRCEGAWLGEYAGLHAAIRAGELPPRHFVSVSVEAGVADRLSGLVTQFWLAVLGRRALSSLAYGDVPGFEAACDSPYIDWTHAPPLPPEVVDPLKFTFKGVRGYAGDRSYDPAVVDPHRYRQLYLINNRTLGWLGSSNLTALPSDDPDVPFIVSASNRGRSYLMALNPHHKDAFWAMGLSPDSTFMCGFFSLCAPNKAIQDYYGHFWRQLQEPGVLTIGIQVRTGDRVFNDGEGPPSGALKARKLSQAARWFACAQALEAAFAAPGQRVLWYLNSDSQVLRAAAKEAYGPKLLTDDALVMIHPDCAGQNAHACQGAAMAAAMQHSLGAMLTFSMAQYHVISQTSGFGRLGAWLSGRWSNIYQVNGGRACDPQRPTPPAESAFHWAGV